MLDYVDRDGNIANDPGDRAKRALQRLKLQTEMSDGEFSLMLAEARLAKWGDYRLHSS